MIEVMIFGILTSIKSCSFFIFFIKCYQGLPTWVMNPSTLEFFLLGYPRLMTRVTS